MARAIALLLLGILIGVGIGLRTDAIEKSLWVDELHTAWTVHDSLGQVAPRAAMGNYSPLYFYLPWLTTHLLGPSEWTLRLPSLAAGVALIPLVFFVVRRWTGCWIAALTAAAWTVLDRQCLAYSLEARCYSWVQLLALLQVFLFARLLAKADRPTRLGWIACSIVLFYLHYTTALLALALLVFYAAIAAVRRSQVAYRPAACLLDTAVIVLCCCPAIPHLMQIAARRENWVMFVGQAAPGEIWTLFPLNYYLGTPWIGAVTAVGLAWLVGWRPAARRIAIPTLCLALAWLFLPLLIVWTTTRCDWARLFMARYVIGCYLGAIVVGAWGVALPARWSLRLLLALAAVALAAWPGFPNTPGPFRLYREYKVFVARGGENWQGAVRWLAPQLEDDGRPIFLRSALIEADALRDRPDDPLLREYCLLPLESIYRLPVEPDRLIPMPTNGGGRLTAEEVQTIARTGGCWLVVRGHKETAETIARRMLHALRAASHPARIAEAVRFGTVIVVRIETTGKTKK